ncbi:MAG TPA: 30S ribosomal protein S3 [Candidatus Latescibacteria bacterium]|nr:30S ribosomal protein S3 [Gemmatimonadota bacterium]MDP6984043.1 30S ribosomal protein S3 [Candidatus Latescibacterota bacterium]MDP7632682.1 30S ribosomal protein S3 [Candidatus Latescibacterota bacterium]MED5414092.1 30S ribosomal protein S3 [Candidatus Latescibacterota bacterium]MEE3040509.1 30S ribosomal protein S3 [Candidatus Latescibacterota bacterium]
MGQKTHPYGFRLGVIKGWSSNWFAEKDFAELLAEDITLRRYIRQRLQRAGVAKVHIERQPKRVTIEVHCARPGIAIGRRGAEVDKLRDELKTLTQKDVSLNIQEVKKPELDAQLVADNLARQLEQRVAFRRAIKRSVASAMRMGAEGIRIECAGRIGGSEMSRRERSEPAGRVPLHTLRADIDFAHSTAYTISGTVGVKCWICHGEVVDEVEEEQQPQQS